MKFSNKTKKRVLWVFNIFAVLYILSPVDLVPLIPGFSAIDDAIVAITAGIVNLKVILLWLANRTKAANEKVQQEGNVEGSGSQNSKNKEKSPEKVDVNVID